MKNILLIAALAGLVACNSETSNSNSASPSADTAQTSTSNAAADHSHMNTDTAGMGGKTMMALMTGMMEGMKTMQSSGNPDNDFAAMMKAHHLSAIEMAQLEAAQGSDPQLKAMAAQMVDDQQREVAEFNTFLTGHSAHGGGDTYFKEAMSIMNGMNMDMDHSGSMDKQFAQMMIAHHQSAVDMSKAYIKSGAHEEKLKGMANKIIASQQKEIAELNGWLAKKG